MVIWGSPCGLNGRTVSLRTSSTFTVNANGKPRPLSSMIALENICVIDGIIIWIRRLSVSIGQMLRTGSFSYFRDVADVKKSGLTSPNSSQEELITKWKTALIAHWRKKGNIWWNKWTNIWSKCQLKCLCQQSISIHWLSKICSINIRNWWAKIKILENTQAKMCLSPFKNHLSYLILEGNVNWTRTNHQLLSVNHTQRGNESLITWLRARISQMLHLIMKTLANSRKDLCLRSPRARWWKRIFLMTPNKGSQFRKVNRPIKVWVSVNSRLQKDATKSWRPLTSNHHRTAVSADSRRKTSKNSQNSYCRI